MSSDDPSSAPHCLIYLCLCDDLITVGLLLGCEEIIQTAVFCSSLHTKTLYSTWDLLDTS